MLLGGDLASVLVNFLQYNLAVIDLPAFACTRPGEVVHAVRGLQRSDLVIAITFRRGLRQTVEGFRQARQRGVLRGRHRHASVSSCALCARILHHASRKCLVRCLICSADGLDEHGAGRVRRDAAGENQSTAEGRGCRAAHRVPVVSGRRGLAAYRGDSIDQTLVQPRSDRPIAVVPTERSIVSVSSADGRLLGQ